ncbi:hypothetical protein pb186bvf_004377 [Paramecium bursaria]
MFQSKVFSGRVSWNQLRSQIHAKPNRGSLAKPKKIRISRCNNLVQYKARSLNHSFITKIKNPVFIVNAIRSRNGHHQTSIILREPPKKKEPIKISFKQRRISCCCQECGSQSKKVRKLFNIEGDLQTNKNISQIEKVPERQEHHLHNKQLTLLFLQTMKTVQSSRKTILIDPTPQQKDSQNNNFKNLFQSQITNSKNNSPRKINKPYFWEVDKTKRMINNLENFLTKVSIQSPPLTCRKSAPLIDIVETPNPASPKTNFTLSRNKSRRPQQSLATEPSQYMSPRQKQMVNVQNCYMSKIHNSTSRNFISHIKVKSVPFK